MPIGIAAIGPRLPLPVATPVLPDPVMPQVTATSVGTPLPVQPVPIPGRHPVGKADVTAKAVEDRQFATVQQAARDAFPVSDQKFTIYKGHDGQYITRLTSLRDGRVTYYPQPEVFRLSRNAGGESSFKITA